MDGNRTRRRKDNNTEELRHLKEDRKGRREE